jgi:hypothetical protein
VLRRQTVWLLPAAVGLGLAAPSFVWAALDRSIWAWDQSAYGQASIGLWATLRTDPGFWTQALRAALAAQPPALVWIGEFFVPLRHVFGSLQVTLLLSVELAVTATLVLLFVAARRLTRGRTALALAGVLLTAGAPLFVNLGYWYLTEPLQTAAVAWVLLILASSPRWHPSLTAAQLAAASLFGLLVKVSTPLYTAVPAIVALGCSVVATRRVERPTWWRDRRLVLSVLASAVLFVAVFEWYEGNFSAAWSHGALGGGHGAARPAFTSDLTRWVAHLGDAVFVPYFDLALGTLLAAAVLLGFARRARLDGFELVALAACLAVPALVVLAYAGHLSSQLVADPRFLVPAIPPLGLALVLVLRIAGSRVLTAAVLVLLAGQFGLSTWQDFSTGFPQELAYGQYRSTPERSSPLAAELDRVVALTCTPEASRQISTVGADYAWLNSNTMTMRAYSRYALQGRRCAWLNLGRGQTDADAAWQMVVARDSPFYLSLDYDDVANPLPPPQAAAALDDPLNLVDRELYRRALSSGRYEVVPGSRRTGLVVLRRTRD